MKKLIVAFAALAVAVVANAGAINWQCYDVMGHDATGAFTADYFSGGIAYLFIGDSTDGIADAIIAGTWTPDGNIKIGSVDEGELEYKNIGTYTGKQTGYMVLFDGDSIAESKFFMISDTVTTASIGSSGAKPMEFSDSMPSQWTALEAVPEPTSGLLLLLGMAGLALKRKQA